MLTDTIIRLRNLRSHILTMRRGYWQWRSFCGWRSDRIEGSSVAQETPLWKYLAEHREGRGIWKFNHYFEAYERHFGRFRGRDVHILEIGIYSGGSLQMWQSYFGPNSRIYGVDIESKCKAYESESVQVLIGDQADRSFWKRVKQEVPNLDVVIDDGGHLPEQQIVTLEELLPHLRPGGVYLCEDILQPFNDFSSYIYGLAQNLNTADVIENNPANHERRAVYKASPLQSGIASIHLYPFMTVIERSSGTVAELIAPKRGTHWEPFLK
jgi:23S rRNA U2552 (ribose-2'-O)-methylase RlmE/FtsJ